MFVRTRDVILIIAVFATRGLEYLNVTLCNVGLRGEVNVSLRKKAKSSLRANLVLAASFVCMPSMSTHGNWLSILFRACVASTFPCATSKHCLISLFLSQILELIDDFPF